MNLGDAIPVKPRLRGVSHQWAFFVAVVAGAVLVIAAPSGRATFAATVYAISMAAMFGASALYHRIDWKSGRARRWMRRLDHSMIYLLIAGTYTPFALLTLNGDTQVAVLAAVWGAAVAGALLRVIWVDAPRWSYVPMYLGLGWAAGFFVPQLLRGTGAAAFVLIAAGGACYTVGGVVYGLKRPNPSPRWFGFHEIFHSLTVAGFACQYIAASLVVYRAA
jgi:hemolysin III